MKCIQCVMFLFPLMMFGMSQEEVHRKLASAAMADGAAYLEVRQNIVMQGQDTLPFLQQAATNPKLPWQQRLVARIWYERLVRGEEIESLRKYDWRSDPQYDVKWERNIIGPVAHLGKIAIPRCINEGLWYYYIELHWKHTNEISRFSANRMREFWPRWCRRALDEQPERYFLFLALGEAMTVDGPFPNAESARYYEEWIEHKQSEAIPMLISRFDAFMRSNRLMPILDRYGDEYISVFDHLLDFADSRHAEMIETFIAERPKLASLQKRLAGIRQRQPVAPFGEPPFRLGRQLVKP